MRFTCVHCGKRYVTNDVLQPGRVYQTKCKGCGTPITLKGGDDGGATSAEVPAPAPRPSSPSLTSVTAANPTPPSPIPQAKPPTPPPMPPTPPPAAAPAARYIDLFEGEGLDAAASPPAPSTPPPPRGFSSTRSAPALRMPESDPFAVAAQTERTPTPSPAPLATRPPTHLAEPPIPEAPRPPRRGPVLLAMGMGAAMALLILLVVGAIWRPWMRSSAPATDLPTSSPTRPLPKPPPATPAPPAADATAAAAEEERLRLEKEQQAAAARIEQERLAAEKAEKDRLAQEERARAAQAEKERQAKAEKERAAKAEKERARAERAEKERQAKEERARAKAERAEKERLAKEERARAERERREKEKQAKAEALPAGLAPEAIQAALAGGRGGFEACFRDHAEGPAPEGNQVTVRFLVQPSGAVTAPEVADQAVAASAAGQCLKAVAAGLKFPAFRGEPARVEAPVAVPQVPRGGRLVAIQFTGFHSARGGGDVGDTVYSEKPNDAVINDRTYADGVVTYAGQVGQGEGSSYGGVGLNVNMSPGPKPIDATRFKSMTIRLAATGTSSLRVRIIGADNSVRLGGCYPVKMQRVSSTLKDYVIEFSDFAPEGWCGARGRSTESTLKELVGFEVADIAVQGKPVTFSVGTIVLNP